MRLRFQKGDLLAVGLTLLLAVLVFLAFLPGSREEAAYAEIYRDGVLLRTVSLGTDTQFTLEDTYRTTVTVENGRIAVTASDCPGEDCVASSWISHTGRSIVCLPARLEIRVVASPGDVDFVVG